MLILCSWLHSFACVCGTQVRLSYTGVCLCVCVHACAHVRTCVHACVHASWRAIWSVTVLLLNNYIALPTSCSVGPKSPRYPITSPPVICLIHFCQFFNNKVEQIRNDIDTQSADPPVFEPFTGSKFFDFEPVTEASMLKLILKTASKSCSLDSIPTPLTKQCLDALVPVITKIINTSLTTGIVPDCFKSVIVKPLLKKPGLDVNDLKNFRPVSNLPFLSKILEKVVLAQLESHLSRNNLREVCQSAYRQNHSTETLCLALQTVFFARLTIDWSHFYFIRSKCRFRNNRSQTLAQQVVILFWYQWHCGQVVHILSYQQNTVCFCGNLKLFVFALEIWCFPRFCPWPHSFYSILSTCFWQNYRAQQQLPEICRWYATAQGIPTHRISMFSVCFLSVKAWCSVTSSS